MVVCAELCCAEAFQLLLVLLLPGGLHVLQFG